MSSSNLKLLNTPQNEIKMFAQGEKRKGILVFS